MLAREHRRCRKESRRYYRNEFGHSGNVRHRYWDFHSKSLNESKYGSCSGGDDRLISHGVIYGRRLDLLRTFFAARGSTEATTYRKNHELRTADSELANSR